LDVVLLFRMDLICDSGKTRSREIRLLRSKETLARCLHEKGPASIGHEQSFSDDHRHLSNVPNPSKNCTTGGRQEGVGEARR
jgi:hypothetical protein